MKIFEINPGLFIWSAVTFVVLLAVLYKFAYGPLIAMTRKRQEDIHGAIHEAERLREEAHALLADYKLQLGNARQEAEEILERARKIGDATRSEMVEEAKTQAERQLEKAREQIDRETRSALKQIRQEVADLTIAATEKVTRKSLTADDQKRLVFDALSEIDLNQFNGN